MALILAINPGGSHSPTLARLARELRGCDLIGADSCAVGITAIDKQVPDLILLPDRPPRGEADLKARLNRVPGGVLTLKLPPVGLADPNALAKQIREMLTGVAGVPVADEAAGPSPHVIAAAHAAVQWIRRRQASWDGAPADTSMLEAATAAPAPATERFEPDDAHASRGWTNTRTADDALPLPAPDSDDSAQSPGEVDSGDAEDTGRPSRRWLLVAAGLALIGAAGAVAFYWPALRGTVGAGVRVEATSAPAETTSAVPAPQTPAPALAPSPAAPPAVLTAESAPEPAAPVSGWVEVFAPFEVSISAANQPVPLDDRGRAVLPAGRHRLRFQNRSVGYDETRAVVVRPTETTTINLTPETTIGVTSNEPAEVLIDGTRAGETPFEGRVALGTRRVTVRTPGGERQFTVEATSKPVQLDVDFSQP